MRIPKRYGQSRVDLCPFCGKDAVTKNKQQVPVCIAHKSNILRDLTCLCGDDLELKDGKFGIYFYCINCGNFNIKKSIEMNPGFDKEEKSIGKKKIKNTQKKEITITSDEVDISYS